MAQVVSVAGVFAAIECACVQSGIVRHGQRSEVLFADMDEAGDGSLRAIERHLGRRPRLVVLGHEWVGLIHRVFRQFISRYGFDEDISNGFIRIGWLNAHWLMLSRRFSEVHLRMAPLASDRYGDEFMEDEILAINALAPEAIVVHLRANELLDSYNNPVDVAVEVWQLGRRLIAECNALHVSFVGCVPRLGGPRDFHDRLLAFNFALGRLSASCPGMSFQKLRGFATMPDGDPLPVSAWSLNGFTPDPDSKFFMKYIHAVRAAAFKALIDIDDFILSLERIPDFFDKHGHDSQDPPPPPPPAAVVVH